MGNFIMRGSDWQHLDPVVSLKDTVGKTTRYDEAPDVGLQEVQLHISGTLSTNLNLSKPLYI